MRKRHIGGSLALALVIYTLSVFYPWLRDCFVRYHPEYVADASSPAGERLRVLRDRGSAATMFWCWALSLDRLVPAPAPPSRDRAAELP